MSEFGAHKTHCFMIVEPEGEFMGCKYGPDEECPIYHEINKYIGPRAIHKQDLNRIKNALHNEAGITKEEIRTAVELAVKKTVEKKVLQLLPDEVSVNRLIDAAIEERTLYYWGKRDQFNKNIEDKVAAILAKKIKLEVKAK